MNGYGNVWSEERVKNELIASIEALMINRMPTADELKSLGRNDLHIKISRTKKYSGWADFLGLDRKGSETLMGQGYEHYISNLLEISGNKVEQMSTKHPYDLLVNGTVKVDIKAGKAYLMRGSRVHSFGINKKDPTCDIYIIIAVDELGVIERTFVIPSHFLKVVSLCIGKDSKYSRFLDKWGYIDEYTQFYNQII